MPMIGITLVCTVSGGAVGGLLSGRRHPFVMDQRHDYADHD